MKIMSVLCIMALALGAEARVAKITADPAHVMTFVRNYIPANPIILECGGFDGTDTALMHRFWPKSTIYTFEPIPQLFEVMQKKVSALPGVHCYPLALADVTGKLTFYCSNWHDTGGPSGSSSLLPPKEHKRFDDHAIFNGSTIDVNAMTLDDWAKQERVDKIDFLWLDMQGYELNMMKVSELVKKALLIYVEVEFIEAYEGQYLYPDVKKWMYENGFELIATDFKESVALAGGRHITPGGRFLYYGNAIFLRKG